MNIFGELIRKLKLEYNKKGNDLQKQVVFLLYEKNYMVFNNHIVFSLYELIIREFTNL